MGTRNLEGTPGAAWPAASAAPRPMLAVLADEAAHDRLLKRDDLVFEPKYDGIRALIEVSPVHRRGGRPEAQPGVRIWSRLGNDKTAQFPEIVDGLTAFGSTWRAPIVLDGEIVAVDAGGGALPFQHLQGRIHQRGRPQAASRPTAVVFIAFDLLRDGSEDLRPRPFTERRSRLADRLAAGSDATVRLVRSQQGGGLDLRDEGQALGWEGVIAKDPTSRYLSGARHAGWQKIKFVRRQEFVVGGWTEGRGSRGQFGALLVGYYPARPRAAAGGADDRLVYAGHVGSGFSVAALDAIGAHLRQIEIEDSPFTPVPAGNEPTRWVDPSLVIDVKFSQWTTANVLRHPVYLGVRTDIAPQDVRREDERPRAQPPPAPAPTTSDSPNRRRRPRQPAGTTGRRQAPAEAPAQARPPAAARTRAPVSTSTPVPAPAPDPIVDPAIDVLCTRLQQLEASRKRGTLLLPDHSRIPVGNLHKVFWPEPGLTKGDLVRFNLRVSPYLLPVVADRPLVMKRFPNGIDGKWFYQHRSPDQTPDGIRVETVRERPDRAETGVPYLIGGSLQTLTYMAQLAVISQDPWFSRLPDIGAMDVAALDLDPMPDAPFSKVIEVARWLHDELARIGTPCAAKTSGASGLHIYIPLPPGTPYDAGMIFCQILATIVASRHPNTATVERMVRKRPADVVYIDYLQNIYGKTLASAYSARASPFAGVSTPLTWDEVHDGLKSGLAPQDFTVRNVFDRLAGVGDLWAGLRSGDQADLRAVLGYARP